MVNIKIVLVLTSKLILKNNVKFVTKSRENLFEMTDMVCKAVFF